MARDRTTSDQGSPLIRAFVALSIDETVRAAVGEAQAALRRVRCRVGWVPLPNVHLSLAFLGAVARETVPMLAEALDDAAAKVPPFAFEVAGIGSFGRGRAPRVIWAGVEPCEPLYELQRYVAAAVAGAGLRLDDRPYKPHLTLGRVRSARGCAELLAAMGRLRESRFGTVAAGRMELMRSVLGASGARYALLHASPLHGSES